MAKTNVVLVTAVLSLTIQSVYSQEIQGCSFDTQCKGERICERGICVPPFNPSRISVLPIPPSRQVQTPNQQVQLPQSDPQREFVRVQMKWCTTDWGHNEGAQEAINYINSAVSAGYANQVSAVIGIINNIPMLGAGVAGEVLKRPPIIDAARALVLVNPDIAIKLALTCQAHNAPIRSRLNAQPNLVAAFLRGELG
ncbi:hypothetical protein Q5698_22830 (plasmid) [Brucella intermedia]|uniref:hypothetical protein n=1 Tax=Brucella intermedia TaxID=94625 RepID=UPI002732CBC4|nr:hypothetical protein [Brucella intermedia]WLF99796.1 hypothetical protein Q5698_22830 [Brucella intermedia]